ncbi:hypothetical protein [Agrobacterium tumefaciens]
MAEVRGEKVKFSKRDIVALHDLPSAQAEDPLIVHCPAPRSMARALIKIFAALFVLAFLSIGGIIVSVETGSIDNALSSQAQQALERALGPPLQRANRFFGHQVLDRAAACAGGGGCGYRREGIRPAS